MDNFFLRNILKKSYSKTNPRERLITFLNLYLEHILIYKDIVDISLTCEVLSGYFETETFILPLIKDLNKSLSSSELKIISISIVSFIHIVFLKTENFENFLEVDLTCEEDRVYLIERLVGNYKFSLHDGK